MMKCFAWSKEVLITLLMNIPRVKRSFVNMSVYALHLPPLLRFLEAFLQIALDSFFPLLSCALYLRDAMIELSPTLLAFLEYLPSPCLSTLEFGPRVLLPRLSLDVTHGANECDFLDLCAGGVGIRRWKARKRPPRPPH